MLDLHRHGQVPDSGELALIEQLLPVEGLAQGADHGNVLTTRPQDRLFTRWWRHDLAVLLAPDSERHHRHAFLAGDIVAGVLANLDVHVAQLGFVRMDVWGASRFHA